jgi:hypothetical protein
VLLPWPPEGACLPLASVSRHFCPSDRYPTQPQQFGLFVWLLRVQSSCRALIAC